MQTTRRDFLKLGVGASAVAGVSALGFSIEDAQAATRQLKIARAKEVHSICRTAPSAAA
jgi:anaerobic selenocysteine-containing dehydrogenase